MSRRSPFGGAGGGTSRGGFARRGALHNFSLHFGPNMTPMVDVVMVILVFFMASAAFLGSEWYLRAALVADPSRGSGSSPTAQKPPDPLAQRLDVLLDLDERGRTVVTGLDFQRAPLADFIERVKKMPKDKLTEQLQVVIRPAFGVPYEDAVRVHEACRGAGIWRVGLGRRSDQ